MTLRNSQEADQLITVGEFAKLANTSKRTLHWYDKKGLLKPAYIDTNNYRYYHPNQVIDFQVIYLMRSLNFSLDDIGNYLEDEKNWQDLFKHKEKDIKAELQKFQNKLLDIQSYYQSLDKNGTLIDPEIKNVSSFDIYYLKRQGPYAKIQEYDQELASKFRSIPSQTDFVTLFKESEYNPRNAEMVIGAVFDIQMKLKKEAEDEVRKMTIPEYKALTYKHYGLGTYLSLMWKQLEKYAKSNGFKQDKSFPFYDLEFYRPREDKRISNEDDVIFEIHLPIE